MVNFAGKWEHVKNENVKEFTLAVSNDAVYSSKVDDVKTTLDISGGGDSWTINLIGPAKTFSASFKGGAEFDDPIPTGVVLKSVASVAGNKIVIASKLNGNDVGARTYEFSDNELVITLSAKNTPIVAKRFYKRV